MRHPEMVWLEALSYVVTILGFPTAIYVIVREERMRRRNQEAELHRNLSEEYDNFLRLVLDNSDLLLLSQDSLPETMTNEQRERTGVMFRMLVSLFEKAFIILYRTDMDRDRQRRWLSWKDDMIEWCQRDDFRAALPGLLDGEDPEFSRYILGLAEQADAKP